jgi:hypothetical protein
MHAHYSKEEDSPALSGDNDCSSRFAAAAPSQLPKGGRGGCRGAKWARKEEMYDDEADFLGYQDAEEELYQ